jgi:hypothetical protein
MRNITGVLLSLAVGAAVGPASGAERAYHPPRNAFGQPDIEGVWSNASFTHLERPLYAPRLVLTPEEAAQAAIRMHQIMPLPDGVEVGQNESEHASLDLGDGYARVRGELRSAMIVEPGDGRLPFRAEALKRLGLDAPSDPLAHRDNPEERTVTERCISGENALPPALPSPDSNYVQIVQTRDHVALYSEKYHEVRVVRLGARPDDRRHADPAVTSWQGDEVGWWEGDTLVVETTNFSAASLVRPGRLRISPGAKVVERFTRTSAGELMYAFTVSDPAIYTQTWRAELPFRASPTRILEDACHEGNYSLAGILAGAREDERAAARRGGR